MNIFGYFTKQAIEDSFPNADNAYQKSDKIRLDQNSKKDQTKNFTRCKKNIQNAISRGDHMAFCVDLNRASLDSLIQLGYKVNNIDEVNLKKYGCDSVFVRWDKS